MSIKYKDIVYKNEKVCAICNTACYNDGIKITDTFICENCVDRITLLNCEDRRYKRIKESIKVNLIKNLKL